MSEPAPFPKQAEGLRLRGRIRPVTRINRKVLAAGAVLAGLGLLAALSAGLRPPGAGPEAAAAETYPAGAGRMPDGLSRLPVSYDSADIPRLGAPLAGDLGGTFVAEERAWGLEPDWDVPPTEDFRPSPVDEAVRARRLAEARLADDAAKAGLFFALTRDAGAASAPPSPGPGAGRLAFAARGGEAPAAGSTALAPEPGSPAGKPALARRPADAGILNPHEVADMPSPYQVMAGSMIAAALLTGVQSDLPGTVTAQVTRPVHDSVTGAHLLIPQGARLIGRYQSDISFGQARALVAWDRIVFPDGASLQISEPASDPSGAAGLAGRTDNHWDQVLAAGGLATLLGIGAGLGDGDDSETLRAVRRGFQDSVSQTGERIVERSLGIRPTIRIEAGTPVRVLVTRDLVLRPYRESGPQ